jgi:hypothetical protein
MEDGAPHSAPITKQEDLKTRAAVCGPGRGGAFLILNRTSAQCPSHEKISSELRESSRLIPPRDKDFFFY